MAEMIRLATWEDQDQLENLWDSCFEKRTDPFFQFYFSMCFQPLECLVLEVDGEIRAAVHLRRYDLCVRGVICPVTYIVGLATWAKYRGQGYASQLLTAALAESRRLGRYANILMPSAAGFYLPKGWSIYCHQWQRSASLAYLRQWLAQADIGSNLYARGLTTTDGADCAHVYQIFTQDFSGYARRQEKDWQRWLTGNLVEGQVLGIYRDSEPVAYAAYSHTNTELLVSEWAAVDVNAKEGLASALLAAAPTVEKVMWQAPLADSTYLYWPDGAEHTYVWNRTLPYMMICPTDMLAWWRQIPTAAVGQVVVTLKDREGKAHTYRCTTTDQKVHLETSTQTADVSLSEADMMALLVGRVSAKKLSMLGRLQGKKEAIQYLDLCYPKVSIWINEWY